VRLQRCSFDDWHVFDMLQAPLLHVCTLNAFTMGFSLSLLLSTTLLMQATAVPGHAENTGAIALSLIGVLPVDQRL
jgi:ABC-type uncharacterized transport system YnjBCD permease subunit